MRVPSYARPSHPRRFHRTRRQFAQWVSTLCRSRPVRCPLFCLINHKTGFHDAKHRSRDIAGDAGAARGPGQPALPDPGHRARRGDPQRLHGRTARARGDRARREGRAAQIHRPPLHGQPRCGRSGGAQPAHRPLPARAPHLRARWPGDAADEPLGRGAAVPGGPCPRHRRDRPPGRARRGEAIYIERVEARRALRVPSAIGRGYPAHATNLGKVLLADLPRERVAEIVAEKGLASYTPNTITDPVRLEAELERIRERGYAIDDEEYDEGLRCIGAGVRDHSGHVVSALGIGGPVTRITPARVNELAELVMTAANGLSRRLGAHQSGA